MIPSRSVSRSRVHLFGVQYESQFPGQLNNCIFEYKSDDANATLYLEFDLKSSYHPISNREYSVSLSFRL